MRSKTKIWTLAFFIATAVFLQTVSAAKIGVTPASINFPSVLRSGYAERPIRIISDSIEPVKVSIEKRGEIADWITIEETEFEVSRAKPKTLLISVTPPSDVPNGVYEGFVRIIREKSGKTLDRHATGLIVPTLDLHVTVEITDREIRGCKAQDFKIQSVEKGDFVFFTALIQNTGNVRFAPLISLDIWNTDLTEIVKEIRFSEKEIKPTKKEKVVVKFLSDELPIGQYWVEASAVDCYTTQTLTFDVLEPGALRANGVLKRIEAPVWTDVGETVPINVVFANTGEKPLQAKFKGKITRNNKVVQIIESDEKSFVPIGEETTFQFYFTPKEPGRYLFSGRVFYAGKRTYEKSTVINARQKNSFLLQTIKILTYIILIAIIAYLISKIRQEKKQYYQRIRKIK